jgi:hypothetical protein
VFLLLARNRMLGQECDNVRPGLRFFSVDTYKAAETILVRKTKIVLLGTAAAVIYGIVHDQITARLCVEYFTIAHPPLFPTDSPTILGICWGIAATIGVGALLGALLALVSQSDNLPPLPVRRVLKPILVLLAATAISAALAGLLGFELSRRAIVGLPATFAELVPASRHHRFMAVWFAHGASYLVGVSGGALVILRIWRQRGGPRVLSVFPRTKGAILRALFLVAIAGLVVWFRFAK